MTVCDFTSPLDVVNKATHYRQSRKDGQGPVSRIVHRERCPACGGIVMLRTDTGINATFTRLHPEACVERMVATGQMRAWTYNT
jgi:hypothetical protein